MNTPDPDQIDKDEMQKILSCFRHFRDYNLPESYSVIKNVLWWIEDTHIPKLHVPKNKRFSRCRPHDKGEKFFYEINDLSYRRDIFNIWKFGRANEPLQSMFYCSDNPLISFTETSIVARQNIDVDVEIFTTGIWEATSEFPMAHLIVKEFNNGAHIKNDFIKETLTQFREQAKEFDIQPEWLDLLSFFSEEFMERGFNDKYYKTSAAFANRIYDFVGENHERFGGLIYPSAIYPEMGANLAIKPEVVDTHLKLIGARRSTSTRVGEFEYLETESIDCKEIDYKTGKIIWE